MFNKISSINVDTLRKEKLIKYAKSSENNSEKTSFIDNFLLHYCKQKQYNFLRASLEDKNFHSVLETINYDKIEEPKEYKKFSKYGEISIIVILEGEISLEMNKDGGVLPKNIKTFKKGDQILINDEFILENELNFEDFQNNTEFQLVSKQNNTEILILDRILWNQKIQENEGGENQQKLETLKKCFPSIKSSDQRKALQQAKYFISKKYNFGAVLTTPTSGSSDLFTIKKGKVLIFMPTAKVNEKFTNSFVIIQILEQNAKFNELHCLFDKEQIYGTVAVEDETELLHISRANLPKILDEDQLGNLRGDYQAKERLQKAIIRKLQAMQPEALLKQQQTLCEQKGIKYDDLVDKVKKSTDPQGRIVTFSHQNEKDKNLKTFEAQMKKKDPINFQKLNGVLMTPRITSKDGKFKGLDANAQHSLLFLRSEGMRARKNQDNQNSNEIVEQQREALQNLDKDILIQKKTIQKLEEEEPKNINPPEKRNMVKRCSISKEDALLKLGINPIENEELKNDKEESVFKKSANSAIKKPVNNMNSAFLNIEKKSLADEGLGQKKANDKFSSQRKRLLQNLI